MFIIEDHPYTNPYKHSEDDTLDTLNLTFHYNTTQALVAAVAHMAKIDTDSDGVPDDQDNCPANPNGPALGACIPDPSKTCRSDADCGTGISTSMTCSMNQEDSNADGTGDICDSYTTTTTVPARLCPAGNVLGPECSNLENLREFRDSGLLQSDAGRWMIKMYYNNADSINAALERSPLLRAVARAVLEILAPLVRKKEA